MKRLLIATATAVSLLSGVTHTYAATLPDYTDAAYTCDKGQAEKEISALFRDSIWASFGLKLLYVKGEPVEVSRDANELRCSVTIAISSDEVETGTLSFVNRDDHALVNWKSPLGTTMVHTLTGIKQ